MSRPPLWPAWLMAAAFAAGGAFFLAAFGIEISDSYDSRAGAFWSLGYALVLLAIAALFGRGAMLVAAEQTRPAAWKAMRLALRLMALLLVLAGLFAGGCGILVLANPGPYSPPAAALLLGILPGTLALALAYAIWRATRPPDAPPPLH